MFQNISGGLVHAMRKSLSTNINLRCLNETKKKNEEGGKVKLYHRFSVDPEVGRSLASVCRLEWQLLLQVRCTFLYHYSFPKDNKAKEVFVNIEN
jgi:hypothetical protein